MKTSEESTQGGHRNTVPAKLSKLLSRLKRVTSFVLRHPALLASLTVTGLLMGGRKLTLLEPLELSIYDQLVQLRPALPPDPNLLIVEVNETDIKLQDKWPLTDATIERLLKNLEQHQPAVIGLDIYRDKKQEPGNAKLSARLSNSDRIIPVCKLRNADDPGVSPPSSVPTERVGFSDLAVDRPNGIVRRALLFVGPAPNSVCTTPLSFSFQLARNYLKKTKNIEPELTRQNYLRLGKTILKPLSPNDGGYQDGDTGGYQILLNYRSSDSLARTVTLTDVLNNRIEPNWVKDKIVLIGVTAPSIDDAFYTPYSSRSGRLRKMPGVVVHGQIVSQLLSAALNGRSGLWFWPEWGEVVWIWVWSLTGGVLVRVVRHPGKQALVEGAALGLLFGVSIILFLGSGWIPIVAPTLGLLVTSTGVLTYNAYQAEEDRKKVEQERKYIEEKVREQANNLAKLQELLEETQQTQIPPDDEESATEAWNPEEYEPTTALAPKKPAENAALLAGHYKIIRVLGSGGFGLTYLAQDTHRPGAPECVVKRLKPAHRDERFLKIASRLFTTEAEILEKLGNHPQIPRLLAHFEESSEFYLVQEYIEGHPLNQELPVDKRLPEAQVVQLLKGVLEILVFIHDHSVIHRDIKPSNIMRRDSDGQVVLIDFGAVKQIQPQENNAQEGHTIAVGTRGYAPPEQYAGHPSFSSDIYALGMIGIQALTGIPPHQLPVAQETGDVSWRHLAHASEEFAQILEKMVRYHFVTRYQSAALVLEDLKSLRSK